MTHFSPLPLALVLAVFGGGVSASATAWFGASLLLAFFAYSLGGAITLIVSVCAFCRAD